jgi:hypothetical protein
VLLQPGWRGSIERILSDRPVQQWSADEKGRLSAVLSWQSSSLDADRMWLAADPETEDKAIPALVCHATSKLKPTRKLGLNYPAGRGNEPLQQAGFKPARTLIWMDYDTSRRSTFGE